ncbi:MAG: crotonase/enoyl-CoA hydratase family protein [Desulfobacterales bacterium]|nr:MAG: crotonase/enoyl-CoA hydratase family protein [Desulfobacterales bacterium]
MEKTDPFKIEREAHLVWLTLNRPEKRNAMGVAFFKGLGGYFDAFDRDPAVRVVIIKAAGKSFTAGTDLEELGALLGKDGADERDMMYKDIRELQQCINRVERCRKPVIAAVHSHCIGGGLDLISACDIRLATQDAVFSIRETRMGIIADLGTLQRLPSIIGQGWFRELALTGRDFTAPEALQMGLITRIVEDRQALYATAAELAAHIAACPPLAVQGTKDVLLHTRDHGVAAGLQYVAQKNAAALPSEDLLEAVAAFMEKRPPVFKGK